MTVLKYPCGGFSIDSGASGSGKLCGNLDCKNCYSENINRIYPNKETRTMEPKPQSDCEDCKGTGLIETQGLIIGNPYFCKTTGKIVRDCEAVGPWEMTQCSCVGEEKESK